MNMNTIEHNKTNTRIETMKYWDMTTHEGEARIEWNESATFNLQVPIGGQWVDIECFTIYGLDDEHEAYAAAYEWYVEHTFETIGD